MSKSLRARDWCPATQKHSPVHTLWGPRLPSPCVLSADGRVNGCWQTIVSESLRASDCAATQKHSPVHTLWGPRLPSLCILAGRPVNSRGAFGGNVSACLLIAGFAVFCEVRCPRLCPADAIAWWCCSPHCPGKSHLWASCSHCPCDGWRVRWPSVLQWKRHRSS